MTKDEIEKLISTGIHPGPPDKIKLVETHISWVLLSKQFVYKIKKPIIYSFLDFSTIEKRKYFCEREVELNRRLTTGIYLDVLPVVSAGDRIFISDHAHEGGELIDYAIKMTRVDRSRQMDVMLMHNQVRESDIIRLAEKIASFHKSAKIIHKKDVASIRQEFNDLEGEKPNLAGLLVAGAEDIISRAITSSDIFIENNQWLLSARLKAGFYRDVHGDLHSRNVFLLQDPQPFDCLEFNDGYREIDVLNEVAFICMDLDSFGRQDLSGLFIRCYNKCFPAMTTEAEHQLFIYYKAYRANVRAKVNSLRLRNGNDSSRVSYLAEAGKYLGLMEAYIKKLAL
jgi:uncharacterized protein